MCCAGVDWLPITRRAARHLPLTLAFCTKVALYRRRTETVHFALERWLAVQYSTASHAVDAYTARNFLRGGRRMITTRIACPIMTVGLLTLLYGAFSASAQTVVQPSTEIAQARAGAASTQQQVVLSYFHDVLDGRKIGLLENLFLSDCVIHRPEGTTNGMVAIRSVVERNIAAYSKFETEMHDIFESGDRVVVRITHRGIGSGVFHSRIGDHDVKGKPVTWDAIAIFRMQNGKIAEQWVNRDELGILLSLGVLKRGDGAR
jgi:predicted ester cyclase